MTQSTNKKLQTIDDLFGEYRNVNDNNQKDKAKVLPTYALVPFKGHPFKLYEGKRFEDMVKSIGDFGIIQPIIVRPYKTDDKLFEILAGHNRWNVAIYLKLPEVPVNIMDGLNDEEAMLIVTETNLMQRSFADLSHSERALVLAKHHEALKSQGKRVDLIEEIKILLYADEISDEETFRHSGEKLNSDTKTGMEYGLSGRSVSRYLRINKLNEDLKKMLDEERVSFLAGVELSYLSEDNQIYLVDILNNSKYKIDTKVACKLRQLQKLGKLNESTMEKVLPGEVNAPPKVTNILKGVKLKPKVIKKYFNEKQTEKEVEEIIDKALDYYFHQQKPNAN
jgi:ParB family chromosome partitioning protein